MNRQQVQRQKQRSKRVKRSKQMTKRAPQHVVRIKPIMSADKLIVRLRYPFRKLLYSLASQTTSFRFVSNGPYDVDPALGSTPIPGFQEYSALYSYNRVVHSHFHVILANIESFPVNVYLIHSNTDPGTTGIDWFEYANNAYGQIHCISSMQAQPAKTINSRIRPQTLVGDRTTNTDQNFVGTATSNPTDLTYVGIGVESAGGTNLLNGVWVTGWLEMTVEFFDRKTLLTSFRANSQQQREYDNLEQIAQKSAQEDHLQRPLQKNNASVRQRGPKMDFNPIH